MGLCTAKQAAEYLQVSRRTVWRWGREGKLRVRRFGRTVRYDVEGGNEHVSTGEMAGREREGCND